MRVQLHNFRCYGDAEYEIPDSGLVLLSGPSGSGKSTILKAILYALFGVKAVRKPYSFGTTTCSVTLEWMNMTIKRTNRPNRLTVNDTLEDVAAQAVIDERLGMGYDEFMVSSYIPQKNNASVLSLSQTDQLQVIKTLAFEQDTCERYKDRLKEMIKASGDNLLEKRTELQFIQKELSQLDEQLLPVEFPLECGDDDQDTAIQEYKARVQSFNHRLAKIMDETVKLEQRQHSATVAHREYSLLQERQTELRDTLSALQQRNQELTAALKDIPADIEEQLVHTKQCIKYLELQAEHLKLTEQYNSIRQEEVAERQALRETITAELWNESEADIVAKITEMTALKQYQLAIAKLAEIGEKLDGCSDYSKQAILDHIASKITDNTALQSKTRAEKERLLLEKELVNCPECGSCLRWADGKLILAPPGDTPIQCDYSAQITQLENRLDKIAKDLRHYEKLKIRVGDIIVPCIDPQGYSKDVDLQLETLQRDLADNKKREQELQRLNELDKKSSPALRSIQQQIDKVKKDVTKLQIVADDTVSVEELKQSADQLETTLANYKKNTSLQSSVTRDIENVTGKFKATERKISELETSVNIDVKALAEQIEQLQGQAEQIKAQHSTDQAISEQLDEYLRYRDGFAQVEKWRAKERKAEKRVKQAERVHAANLTLRDKYVQAEILALESTITSINEHTRYYLDTFFTDHELSARLEAVTKNKKIQNLKINTTISYKGNEYDNISQMSGGEFDRCTLASICGINSMLSSPILILDESLASLDADTNTEIIRFLSELAQDKLILVCSHEAVKGIFDVIITL